MWRVEEHPSYLWKATKNTIERRNVNVILTCLLLLVVFLLIIGFDELRKSADVFCSFDVFYVNFNVENNLTTSKMKLEHLNALFDCKDFFKRGVIMLPRCFKRATLAGIFSGGIFSARHLIAFTASVSLDVHCGGFFFNMGNNKIIHPGTLVILGPHVVGAVNMRWGDACDNKGDCMLSTGLKKLKLLKTFTSDQLRKNPNQKTPTEFPKSDIKQYFTFADVPPSKWRERSIEMLMWCTAELQYYTIDVVIKRFLTRLQGRLKDWYHSLGEYRQHQIQQSIYLEALMSIIYSEFIGSPWEHTTHARQELLKMKCYKCKDKSSMRLYYTKKKYHSKKIFKLSSKPSFLTIDSKKWKFIKKKARGRTSDDASLLKKSLIRILLSSQIRLWKPHDIKFHGAAYGGKIYAKVLSKFDLKYGFWQLGIKPEDRLKMAFCIPNHHYKWKVIPFGLKNAPSAFQKEMITIFEPFLANTLVYIDDILLFSPDEQSHAELLSKFYSLVTKYVIMLLEKKKEVLKFPDELSSQKMIQQFLGDECLGAVLLVQDNNNKRHVCGYKSGTFKASEQHYHSTFKEIITVKRGIKKFQFHLIGHEFQVEMDMSSFLRPMLRSRKLRPSYAQLLRWSNWFSQWKFIVKHIKGTKNVLADFLSRPKAYKSEENYPKEASQIQKHTPHLLSMFLFLSSA
ncbi:putative reverse transcriptase domain, viral movement protein [Tanacetum coccineum]|uniref:Reverse transcriptase domain, viral movement protein n=1 Tax=Tanacetum coccineum TaxID=301880 RepID=A0ABQ4Z6X2_9ASTR